MKDIQPHNIENRITRLQEDRKKILALSSEKALDAILESPEALPLVHSFPADDFYFLIHDIGVEDALELLSMASSKQWEYIIDHEVWHRDRIDGSALIKWFDRLMKADAARFISWLKDDKRDMTELLLYKNIEVRVREHDEDPNDFGPDFFTFDDVYYIKFIKYPFEKTPDDDKGELRQKLISNILKGLSKADHASFQFILHETSAVLPAEVEEELYRLKNIRLAEKGFLPFEEAVGIYTPLSPAEILATDIKRDKYDETYGDAKQAVPLYPLSMIHEDNMFISALETMGGDSMLSQLQAEFATLCNTIVAADKKTIRERGELSSIVKKACGYISLGLHRLAEDRKGETLLSAAESIRKHSLTQIFRSGYSMVFDLRKKALELKNTGWFAKSGLPLSFWGEDLTGALGGLLVKKPLFFDNYRTGVLYRDFYSIKDVLETEKTLRDTMAIDEILSAMKLDVKPVSGHLLSYKNLILTMWARAKLNLKGPFERVPLNLFRPFYDNIFSGPDRAGPNGETRSIKASVKTSFLKWLAGATGMDEEEISLKAGQILEELFMEIENEYGRVLTKDLDPRYSFLFLLNSGGKK